MRGKSIRRRCAVRAVLPLMLLFGGCATGSQGIVKPEPHRTAEIAVPAIPAATTPCAYDPAQLCNSDEETANVLVAYDEALAAANRKLRWLADFFSRFPE